MAFAMNKDLLETGNFKKQLLHLDYNKNVYLTIRAVTRQDTNPTR